MPLTALGDGEDEEERGTHSGSADFPDRSANTCDAKFREYRRIFRRHVSRPKTYYTVEKVSAPRGTVLISRKITATFFIPRRRRRRHRVLFVVFARFLGVLVRPRF